MPDTKKKIMVKIPKKESTKGIIINEKAEGYVPKGLTRELIDEVNETTYVNKKRDDVEVIAKNDSVVAAKKAKDNGSTIYMQRREGNAAANKTRSEGGVGNPKVQMYNNPHLHQPYEANTGEKDTYIRDKFIEKDMPSYKKTYVKIAKK